MGRYKVHTASSEPDLQTQLDAIDASAGTVVSVVWRPASSGVLVQNNQRSAIQLPPIYVIVADYPLGAPGPQAGLSTSVSGASSTAQGGQFTLDQSPLDGGYKLG